MRIKPHHFIDIITAYGDGVREFKTHPYGHAVHTVAEIVLGNPDIEMTMDFGADDICTPCIHNKDGICEDSIDTSYRPDAPPLKRDWNLMIDRRWSERLGITEGEILTARSFCSLLRERMGDITDIYREISPEMTADRAKKLKIGLDLYPAG